MKRKGFPKADVPVIIPGSQFGLAKLNTDMEQEMDKRVKKRIVKAGVKKGCCE